MQVERLRREHDELIRSALEKEAEWSELDDRLADLEMENAGLAEVGTRPLSALPSSSRDLDLNASGTGALNMTSFSDMFDISSLCVAARDGGAGPIQDYMGGLAERWEKATYDYVCARIEGKTSAVMLRRLERMSMYFLPQHEKIESEVAQWSSDVERALAESHDAVHARDQAKLDLMAANTANTSRADLWKERIQHRREMIKLTKDMLRRKKELDEKRERDNQKEEMKKQLKTQRRLKRIQEMGTVKALSDARMSSADTEKMEHFFEVVMSRTGAKNVGEACQKVMDQKPALEKLRETVLGKAHKVAVLQEELMGLHNEYSQSRTVGGVLSIKQKIFSNEMDKLDAQIAKKALESKRLATRCTDLNNKLAMTQEGLSHIMNRVKIKFDSVPDGSMDIKDLVLLCEAKLSKLIDLMGVDPQELDPMELENEAYESFLFAKNWAAKARQEGSTKSSFMQHNLRNLAQDDFETQSPETYEREGPISEQSAEERDDSFLVTREHLKLRSVKAASGKGFGRSGVLDIHVEKQKRKSSKKKMMTFS